MPLVLKIPVALTVWGVGLYGTSGKRALGLR